MTLTNRPHTIEPTTESMLLDILERNKKHMPVANISQNNGFAKSIIFISFGKCLNVNKKLSQVIVPRITPSIMFSLKIKGTKGFLYDKYNKL